MTRDSRSLAPVGAPSSGPSVLVVSSDAGLREQVAAWVDETGYEVLMCPGPQIPGYSCMGLRGERCPLDAGADLTVLDLHPTGPTIGDQTGRASLVKVYQAGGRPVLVLADEDMTQPQQESMGAALLERTVDRGAFLASVGELLRRDA